jgi:hypothetical protein
MQKGHTFSVGFFLGQHDFDLLFNRVSENTHNPRSSMNG